MVVSNLLPSPPPSSSSSLLLLCFYFLSQPLIDSDYPKNKTKSDSSSSSTGREERDVRWSLSANACVIMLRTWTGLFLLGSDRQGGLRAVFSMLVQPVPLSLRHTILHLLFRILCIAAPVPLESWTIGLEWSSIQNGSSEERRRRRYDGRRRRKSSSGGRSGGGRHYQWGEEEMDDGVDQPGAPSLQRHERYLRDHWTTLSDLVPGAWSPPPPSGVPIGSTDNGGFRRSNTVGGHNVLDNFAATLVLCLLQCGVVEPLVALGLGVDESNGWYHEGNDDGGRGLSRPATRGTELRLFFFFCCFMVGNFEH